MSQEPNKPVNISVHESSDPSVISPNPDQEADLNDSAYSNENTDTLSPELLDAPGDDSMGASQISIANRSAS